VEAFLAYILPNHGNTTLQTAILAKENAKMLLKKSLTLHLDIKVFYIFVLKL